MEPRQRQPGDPGLFRAKSVQVGEAVCTSEMGQDHRDAIMRPCRSFPGRPVTAGPTATLQWSRPAASTAPVGLGRLRWAPFAAATHLACCHGPSGGLQRLRAQTATHDLTVWRAVGTRDCKGTQRTCHRSSLTTCCPLLGDCSRDDSMPATPYSFLHTLRPAFMPDARAAAARGQKKPQGGHGVVLAFKYT